jgi:hypothetical protein
MCPPFRQSIRFFRATDAASLRWFLTWPPPSQATEQGALLIAFIMSGGLSSAPSKPDWALDEWLGTDDIEAMDPRQAALCAVAQGEWYLHAGPQSLDQVPRLLHTVRAACRLGAPNRRQLAVYRRVVRGLRAMATSPADAEIAALLADCVLGPGCTEAEWAQRWGVIFASLEEDDDHLLPLAREVQAVLAEHLDL